MGSFIFALAVFLLHCGPEQTNAQERSAAPRGPAIEISQSGFQAAYKENPNINILDVRTPYEFTQDGHVKGAKLLPLQQLSGLGSKAVQQIPFEKSSDIYIICRSGNRSLHAAHILRNLGYTNAVSVQGGTSAWARSGNPVSK